MFILGENIIRPDVAEAPLYLILSEAGPVPFSDTQVLWPELPESIALDSAVFIGFWGKSPILMISAETACGPTCTIRESLDLFDADQYRMVNYGWQLMRWQKQHRFCGACGTPTGFTDSEVCLACSSCGATYYPRINPCIITTVTRGDEILLVNHRNRARGYFTCVAGYMHAAEVPEETVLREVLEETGIVCENPRYAFSQAWPSTSSLMLGFHADYVSGEIKIQESEIAEACWFHKNDLPILPPSGTISHQLIHEWLSSRG